MLPLASPVMELLPILLDLVPLGLVVHDEHQSDLDLHGQLHGQGNLMTAHGQIRFSWGCSSEVTCAVFGATASWAAAGRRWHVDLHCFGGFGHLSALSSWSLKPLLSIRFLVSGRASFFTLGAIFL